MECQCETYGWCEPCRHKHQFPTHETEGDPSTWSPASPMQRHVFCFWCWTDITDKEQYILGNFQDNRKACGPDCPDRPAGQNYVWRKKGKRMNRYIVRAHMDVIQTAKTENEAMDRVQRRLESGGYKMISTTYATKQEEPKVSHSRKDYENLAEVLVSQRRFLSVDAYNKMVNSIGRMYAKENPKFQWGTWRKACGIDF